MAQASSGRSITVATLGRLLPRCTMGTGTHQPLDTTRRRPRECGTDSPVQHRQAQSVLGADWLAVQKLWCSQQL